ncbi:MAG: BREX system P-loop protein BrxC [Anaerolineae bacterium]
MTENREVFLKDPTTWTIPNQGVAKVIEPQSPAEWRVLRYEIESFVCEGEYRRGLERILDTYLRHLNKEEQPAVWVSGFYGSGKSHFVRVLEYLWRDVQFPDGATARGIAKLPNDVHEYLRELSIAGRRAGGVWSAAGTLGAGAGSVRLAILAILFRSAGLPEQYPAARFVIWARQNDLLPTIESVLKERGRTLEDELSDLYISSHLAEAILTADPEMAVNRSDVHKLLQETFPFKDEITDDELFTSIADVLALQSATPDQVPCVLFVLDELQQAIGENSQRALHVQNIVEGCSTQFGSKVLFVATGQAALQATPQLQKLQGRFTVQVTLSDSDVERVVRQVALRKAPGKEQLLHSVLDQASGEINRHLIGTRIGASPNDAQYLIPDYPLLPVRRRFWERALRAIDSAGAAGQLRTQLRIVHEATRQVAQAPLGTVVPGDVIYDQLKSNMLQSSVLLRDMAQMIEEQDDGTPDGKLRARLCSLVFIIGKLPMDGPTATGLQATAATLADLMVENLVAGSDTLRHRIPELLQDLVDKGVLMLMPGGEYRLQTRESQEWEADYRRRLTRLQNDDSRIAGDRTTAMRTEVNGILKGLTFTQGTSKTPRKFDVTYDAAAPRTDTGIVPVWVRDEWSVSERTVRDDAQAAGSESPIVFIFIPRREADALKAALSNVAAARETIEARGVPATDEGREARIGMESRLAGEQERRNRLIGDIVNGAKVFQGGGVEVAGGSLRESVRKAVDGSLVRLFPKFNIGDHLSWGQVLQRARQGAPDALAAVGHAGDAKDHPACQAVLTFIGGAGKRGLEIRKQFTGPPYGWPQDAVDGALLALMASEAIRARRNGQPQTVKQLGQSDIGVTEFEAEDVIISAGQRLAIRKFLTDLGLPIKAGEEAGGVARTLDHLLDIAREAGGEPPLPARPSTAALEELKATAGNRQLLAVYEARDSLLADHAAWTRARDEIAQRRSDWRQLERLLSQGGHTPLAQAVRDEMDAIKDNRALLADPDPVPPLIDRLTDALRAELQAAREKLAATRAQARATLEASEEFQTLPEDRRRELASDSALAPVPTPAVGDTEALLVALERTPLDYWRTQAAAVSTRLGQLMEQAAKYHVPDVVALHPPSCTLHTEADVDTYLRQLRHSIMEQIEQGNPVLLT